MVAGADPAAPLRVTVASYAGDAVSTTTSSAIDAGADVTYQVTVSNGTASAQTNVSVPVALPSNFVLQNRDLAQHRDDDGLGWGAHLVDAHPRREDVGHAQLHRDDRRAGGHGIRRDLGVGHE